MADQLTPDQRAELRGLAEAATPSSGWEAGDGWVYETGPYAPTNEPLRNVCRTPENTAFIEAANPATVLALLNALDAAEARLEAVDQACDLIQARAEAIMAMHAVDTQGECCVICRHEAGHSDEGPMHWPCETWLDAQVTEGLAKRRSPLGGGVSTEVRPRAIGGS